MIDVEPNRGNQLSRTERATRQRRRAAGGDKNEFFRTLDGVMNQVDDASGDAQTKVREMLQGNGQDLHTAMIAVEKADLSFQLMMQVRNKIIQAYQTISQMQF